MQHIGSIERTLISDESQTPNQHAELELRIGKRKQTRRETRERIDAAQRGESVEEHHVCNIERLRDVACLLHPFSSDE